MQHLIVEFILKQKTSIVISILKTICQNNIYLNGLIVGFCETGVLSSLSYYHS